ncbi:MAG: carbohydrate ABC transporter permease [Candidatus Gallimonas sp.]
MKLRSGENGKIAASGSAETAVVQRKRARAGISKMEKRESWIAFGFVSIKIVGFLMFTLIPILICFLYAFTNMNPLRYSENVFSYFGTAGFWSGIDNFVNLFTHPLYSTIFVRCIWNTLIQLLSVPLGMALGLLIATLLTEKDVKFKAGFRLLIYFPVVASAVAIGYVWQYIFATEYGLLNQILGLNVNWFSNEHLTRLAIIIKSTWGSVGRMMILYISGCLAISDSYYEAAELDGANRWQKFWRITFPLVSPTTFYLLVTGIIGHMQSYSDAMIFAPSSTGAQTIVWFIWNYGINKNMYGFASAASVLLSIVIMGATILQFKRSNKWVFQG